MSNGISQRCLEELDYFRLETSGKVKRLSRGARPLLEKSLELRLGGTVMEELNNFLDYTVSGIRPRVRARQR